MSEFPLISIIVPVYNVGPYLRQCLDTVINQTYTNLEIIIVVSTSTDDSVEICEEYAKKDERITLIHSEPNGVSDARNRGIEASHGEYLNFIDSDDYIHPEYLSTLYTICAENHCDIAQCGLMRVEIDQNEIISDTKKETELYSGREMCYNYYYNIPDYLADIVVWSKLYRKEIFTEIRFPFGKIYEDHEITHKLFYSAKKVGVTTQILYFYRKVPTSITGVGFTLRMLDCLELDGKRANYFKEKGEEELYVLWYLQYVKSYPDYIRDLKKYYPEQKELRKHLQQEYWKKCRNVIKNPIIPVIEKYIMVLYIISPKSIIILGKSKILRDIKRALSKNYK